MLNLHKQGKLHFRVKFNNIILTSLQIWMIFHKSIKDNLVLSFAVSFWETYTYHIKPKTFPHFMKPTCKKGERTDKHLHIYWNGCTKTQTGID